MIFRHATHKVGQIFTCCLGRARDTVQMKDEQGGLLENKHNIYTGNTAALSLVVAVLGICITKHQEEFQKRSSRCFRVGFMVRSMLKRRKIHSSPSSRVCTLFSSRLLNYLCLVDGGGMWTDPSGVRLGFGSQCAISLLIVSDAVRRGHLGAVGLTVLVIRMLLAGRTPQTFINFILIVRHWWVAAGQRRMLPDLAHTSLLWSPICWDDGAAF